MSTPSTATNTFVANPSPTALRLYGENQSLEIGSGEPPRAFDAPSVSQRERESRPGLLRLHLNPHQLPLSLQPPVIQCADSNVVSRAILPPRHAASRVALDDSPFLFLAGHAPIVRAVALLFKMGSSDAYFPLAHHLECRSVIETGRRPPGVVRVVITRS